MICFLGSVVYGAFSYGMYKFGKGILVSDEDGVGLKKALLDISRAQGPPEIKEMELKALYNYPTYRNIILSMVEEKKNPQHSSDLTSRFSKVRKWWLGAFILYYALTSLAFVPALQECGFQNVSVLGKVLGMLIGNFISAAIVYHCAFRTAGTRLLLVILCFLPLYVLGICIMVGMQLPIVGDVSLDWGLIANFILEVCLPMLLILFPIIAYWITSFYLLKINCAMAKFRKLEHVKILLQM
jgi:hypothetical protein